MASGDAIDRLCRLEEVEYGHALLRLLSLAGWQIAITAEDVSVRKFGVGEVRKRGSVAEVSPAVFTAAVQAEKRSRDEGMVRLRIVE